MEKRADTQTPKELVNPSDLACASECNADWQQCREDNPRNKGGCQTKLAKCVKNCHGDKR